MPFSPMCFKICNGIELIPELLFALKACCSVLLSSAGVMCCACAVSTGVYITLKIWWLKPLFNDRKCELH
jgi:hypothetical protein